MPRLLDRLSTVLVVAAAAVALIAAGCTRAPPVTPGGSAATVRPIVAATPVPTAPPTVVATAAPTASPTLPAAMAPASIAPPSASPSPCTPIQPPGVVSATFQVTPRSPKVGDTVTLSFTVKGGGGLPQYVLTGAAPVFGGTIDPLYSATNGTVDWIVTAAKAGTTTLTLDVTFEARVGCEENPVFAFLGDHCGPFTVTVAP